MPTAVRISAVMLMDYTDHETAGAFRIQNLYPLLKSILKDNDLHFLVPPYNASAQVGSSLDKPRYSMLTGY